MAAGPDRIGDAFKRLSTSCFKVPVSEGTVDEGRERGTQALFGPNRRGWDTATPFLPPCPGWRTGANPNRISEISKIHTYFIFHKHMTNINLKLIFIYYRLIG